MPPKRAGECYKYVLECVHSPLILVFRRCLTILGDATNCWWKMYTSTKLMRCLRTLSPNSLLPSGYVFREASDGSVRVSYVVNVNPGGW